MPSTQHRILELLDSTEDGMSLEALFGRMFPLHHDEVYRELRVLLAEGRVVQDWSRRYGTTSIVLRRISLLELLARL